MLIFASYLTYTDTALIKLTVPPHNSTLQYAMKEKANNSRCVNENHWKPAILFRQISSLSDLNFSKCKT